MISFECKNCGGELEIVSEGVGRCTSCRSKQPIPRVNDEKFNRANRLRLENVNFDDAREIYESIVSENPNEAEAYWGIVLCRYGIEYVKDPYTDEYKPTCNRIIESSIQEDADFKKAVSCASDEENREYYISQARMIDKIQQRILSIARTEKPYDIFISFKATDDVTKEETEDSKRATAIYYSLLEKGYRVFFSKITLKDKAGEEYEPYIYAALKSAKIMILVGTKAEYMNAKWVKNEWRRYNKMRRDGERKLLLPVYANMDPYEFPYELCEMQALDMTQMSFMVSLFGNIERFMGESAQDRNAREASENVDKILEEKGFVTNKYVKWNENGKKFLEVGRFNEAKVEFDKAIEENPNYANAYWNRLLAKLNAAEKTIKSFAIDFTDENDYIMAITYAEGMEREQYVEIGNLCKENIRIKEEYNGKSQAIVDSYLMKDSRFIPEAVKKRLKVQTALEESKAKLERAIPPSNKERVACVVTYIFSVIAIYLWYRIIGGESINSFIIEVKETPWAGVVFLALFNFIPCMIMSNKFTKAFTRKAWAVNLATLGALFTLGISYVVVAIIAIVDLFKTKAYKSKYSECCFEYLELQDEYEQALNEEYNAFRNDIIKLQDSYKEINKNSEFRLNGIDITAYVEQEMELREKYLSDRISKSVSVEK